MAGARVLLLVGLLALAGVAPAATPGDPGPVSPLAAELAGPPSIGCEDPSQAESYDVVAREVPVSYNKWGDFDPRGRVFVPAEKEARLVEQVADRLRAAGYETAARTLEDPGVDSLSEAGYEFPTGTEETPEGEPFQPSPLVQPLVLRAHVGDCVEITLENKLPNPASIHVHNAQTRPGQGMALGSNGPDLTPSGGERTYTVRIPDDPAMEGAHFLHSHADARFQTKHGMIGAVMAEPKGTSWLKPDGSPNPTGPQATIVDPDGPDFREISLFYHDEVELVDRSLDPLPERSPYGEYGPGSKAINLRSEPFLDRFDRHAETEPCRKKQGRCLDESLALSSYTYGDPPVVPKAYVGDPTKFRLVNAGPGQAHVHHLHGGGIRWRLSPVGEDTNFTDGLTKYEDGPTHEHPDGPADHPTATGTTTLAAGAPEASATDVGPQPETPLLPEAAFGQGPEGHDRSGPVPGQHDHDRGGDHGHGDGATELFRPAHRGAGSILVPDAETLDGAQRVAVGSGEDREIRSVSGYHGNRIALDRALLRDHDPGAPVEALDDRTEAPSASSDGATATGVQGNLSDADYHPHNERTDVQMLSPGTSFNAEVECGAGGCQASPGDFLFHCHIAEHYIAGMWGIWRTYDTRQPGLAELPDRQGETPAPVDSTDLLGTRLPNGTVLTEENVDGWIRDQLPPQGQPRPDGASVWNWTTTSSDDGPLYLGEPAAETAWANHEPEDPGERDPITFNPENGRVAFPLLEPHLGKRPPFAPRHGPAPYLGEEVAGEARDRLCPTSTRPLNYSVVATGANVSYNDRGDVDRDGMVFAHARDADAVQNGSVNPPSLVLRANRGDCVDVTLTSQLPDSPNDPTRSRKVNIHTHLVQFDMQATDGSIVGFNYETSVRSAQTTGAGLAAPAEAGDRRLDLAGASSHLREGALVGVGVTDEEMEVRRVAAVDGDQVLLETPLDRGHDAGALVSPEFVRYRWYADVRLGTVYFHDHVDGLETWRHGLFGALVVEPRDSRWLDPHRDEPLPEKNATVNPAALNEHVLDIVGPNGTFREMVTVFQDTTAKLEGPDGKRDLASFNLRSAPLDRRTGGHPLSSTAHGDPPTSTLEAYPGDETVIRLLYGGQARSTGVATFGVTGHRFAREPETPGSKPLDAISFGISSQHDLQLECGAGGCDRLPGNYLYHITQPDKFQRGAWGTLRVHNRSQPDLQPLPTNEDWSTGSIPDRTDRRYDVVATEADVTYNGRTGTAGSRHVLVPEDRAAAFETDEVEPEPLVLRATAGDVVEVELANRLDEPVTLHAGMVSANASAGHLGIPVGDNPRALVDPGETRTYRWHADRAVGLAPLASFAEPAEDPREGLYGGLVVEPAGSTFDEATGTTANVTLPNGTVAREHVVLYGTDATGFQSSKMPYTTHPGGVTKVNYRTAPIWNRTGARAPGPQGEPVGGTEVHTCQVDPENCNVGAAGFRADTGLRNPLNPLAYSQAAGEPATPVLHVQEGQPLILRATTGVGDQIQSHTLAGHSWKRSPAMEGSRVVDTATLGQRETSDAWIPAAGPGGAGDYLYGSHRDAFREAGAWGILRVGEAGSGP
jgi:FtsP/CotA-like multicopper oxidase with cupredoxin domain